MHAFVHEYTAEMEKKMQQCLSQLPFPVLLMLTPRQLHLFLLLLLQLLFPFRVSSATGLIIYELPH